MHRFVGWMALLAATGAFGTVLAGKMPRDQVAGKDKIEMVTVPAGEFRMGADAEAIPAAIRTGHGVMSERPEHGDFDEVPAHTVRIAHPFAVSVTEVTAARFREFDPSYQGNPADPEYAVGISWQQAMDFCAWLSRREGKLYRLPTEAEWEYAARAGGTKLFGNSDAPLAVDQPNAWGLRNLGVGRPEWTLDWYGPYSAQTETDPRGASSGWARVVRGGGLDYRKTTPGEEYPARAPYFERPANRASMAPSFASPRGNIGFRVVQAAMPDGPSTLPFDYFFETAVKQVPDRIADGPDPAKPFMRLYEMFPDIGDRSMPDVGWKLGLARGLGIAYHNTAIQEMPNGDMLAAYYNTPDREDDPDQTILIMRRRSGCETWDMPEPWPYFADSAAAAPVIWNDNGRVWLFWGTPRLIGAWPFVFTTSRNNGASWSAMHFPRFNGHIGAYVPQPINSVVRTGDRTILLPTDSIGKDAAGNGSISAVWGSHDDGKTWYDTGGRTGGRHTTIVMGRDGSILAFGGKNSNIDGRMPLAISRDGGETWQKQKTPFDPLASGERPSVIRLKSGRLFFVADYNPNHQKHVHKDGSYVALSDDDGKTWMMKRLPAQILTVGYTTATQGANGIIHVVTSKNKPDYEIELNEAWVLDPKAGISPPAETFTALQHHTERYANGRVQARWSSARADDGRILLDGPEEFFYASGKPMWRAQFHLGQKIGLETFRRKDGSLKWEKSYAADGSWTWTIYNAEGKIVATSKWRGKRLLSTSVPNILRVSKTTQIAKQPEMEQP